MKHLSVKQKLANKVKAQILIKKLELTLIDTPKDSRSYGKTKSLINQIKKEMEQWN